MKITLKNFDARVLFPEGTPIEEINGVHKCMSGAEYIVAVDGDTPKLTYIGGLSPMFTHSDFPVGDGLWPKAEALEQIDGMEGFTVEYSDMNSPAREVVKMDYQNKPVYSFERAPEVVTLDYNLSNPDIEGLFRFIKHAKRITPNSWECGGKDAITAIVEVALRHYINN